MKNDKFVISKSVLFNLLWAIALMLSSNVVRAELQPTGTYAGLYFSNAIEEFDPDGGPSDTDSNGHIKFKIGKKWNEWASVETHAGFTTNSDETQGIATLAGYVRFDESINDIGVFGLLGFGVIAAYNDSLDNVNEAGFSWGLGVELYGSKDLSLTIEYIALLDESVDGGDVEFGSGDLSFEMIGVGFTYYFSEEASPFVKNQNGFESIRE